MSSPTPPDKNRTKELSNEVRMLIAFALMGAILLVTPWVYRKLGIAPPPPDSKTQTAQKTAATARSNHRNSGRRAHHPVGSPRTREPRAFRTARRRNLRGR